MKIKWKIVLILEKRLIGTPASDEVIETVLKNNENYKGTAVVVGSSASTYYTPLHDKDGEIVGMWFVGIYTAVIEKKISNAMLSINGILLLLLLLSSAIAYIIGRSISTGFISIKKDLEQMEDGNFNISFTAKKQTRKDEIGSITRSFLHMQENIRDIISSIKEEATSIENSSSILAEGADNVYSAIEEISATTQQLSAGMEETAASSQEMNATSIAIEEQIGRVASKATNGQEIASEIKGRAENLKKVALESQFECGRGYGR